jgi:ABC-type bacteriocin/lantibiotic exporter with double-glycine peptidase domain
MLFVPKLRQPDGVSCLPTCIQAALAFHGRQQELGELRARCAATSVGSNADLAVHRLNDAGYDAELAQIDCLEEPEETLSAGLPPIVLVSEGRHSPGVATVGRGCSPGPGTIAGHQELASN